MEWNKRVKKKETKSLNVERWMISDSFLSRIENWERGHVRDRKNVKEKKAQVKRMKNAKHQLKTKLKKCEKVHDETK